MRVLWNRGCCTLLASLAALWCVVFGDGRCALGSVQFGVNGVRSGLDGITPCVGKHCVGPINPDAFRLAADAGLRSVRVFAHWWEVETIPGFYNWDAPIENACGKIPVATCPWPRESLRSVLEAATHAGLRVTLVLTDAVPWASCPEQTTKIERRGLYACPFHIPQNEQGFEFFADRFAQFSATAVRSLPGIETVEVWNQPNRGNFHASPRRYQILLERVYAAVKAVDQSVKVAGPSLGRTTNLPRDFRKWLVNPTTHSLAAPIDVLSYHDYDPPRVIAAHLLLAKRFAATYHIPAVWITEFGWASGGENNCPMQTRDVARSLGSVMAHVLESRDAADRFDVRLFYYYLSARVWDYPSCTPLLDQYGKPTRLLRRMNTFLR